MMPILISLIRYKGFKLTIEAYNKEKELYKYKPKKEEFLCTFVDKDGNKHMPEILHKDTVEWNLTGSLEVVEKLTIDWGKRKIKLIEKKKQISY